MSLIGNIARAYRDPRSAMQAQVDKGITEPQTLFYGMLFGMINLIASYPRAAMSTPDPDILRGMIAGLFIAYIFFLPLVLYGFSAIIHWVIQRFGGRATWAQARRAFNWSAVITIPFVLLSGAVHVLQNDLLKFLCNSLTAAVFLWQLWLNFNQVEFKLKR